MFNGLYRMVQGMNGEIQRQEAIARNLVGSNMPGYKAQHLTGTFQAQLDGSLAQAGDGDASVLRLVTDFSQGSLTHTGRALDFAIHGDGFFRVSTPDGRKLYTRNGQFHLSAEGTLVTQEGYTLEGESGPLTLGANDSANGVQTSEDGTVAVVSDGVRKTIGRVGIYDIATRPDLQRGSANYFFLTQPRDPDPARDARLVNGYREEANVSPVQEMARMVQSLREFEIGQQLIRMQSDLTRDEQQRLVQ
jgi:flagellar basal body rod protein FlgG